MNCRLCSSNQVSVLYKGVDGYKIDKKFDIYKCSNCKVAYTHPFLTQKEYSQYHNSNQVAFNGVGEDDLVDQYTKNKQPYWKQLSLQKRRDEIKQISPKAKRILDIGCGAGFFIDYMNNNGYEAAGIELSPWGYNVATKVLKLNVKNDLIENLKIPSKKYDVITLYDIIEHTTQPIETLSVIKKWLKRDGILIINVPNLSSIVSSASGKYWNKLAPPDHTFHFNKTSMHYLLKNSGYSIIRVSTNSGSPFESMSQLAGGFWRIPAKISTSFSDALENQNQPFRSNKSYSVAAIKGSKRVAEKTGHIAKPLLPIINTIGAGEGLRVVATPA